MTARSAPRLALLRVHLRSVGPDAARFDPLTLDFSLGDQAAERALVGLTNTGGKTTLIRLLSSIVVPAARDQVGKANIGEYIGTGDVAHVAAEWQTDAGTIVTGYVAEWPDRLRPSGMSISELQRRWYAFRSGELGLQDLPYEHVDDHGVRRKRTLKDFCSRTSDMFAAHPNARLTWGRNQSEWSDVLDKHTPLDPELFRYQMRMNDEEAGAGALVSRFSTADAVIAFFVGALNDTDSLKAFTDTLENYAKAAARRGEHTVELGFCTDVQAALSMFADAHQDALSAAAAAKVAEMAAGEFAGTLTTRIGQDQVAVAAYAASLEERRAELRDTSAALNRLDERRAQLNLEAARLKAASTQADLDAAGALLAEADLEMNAWRGVEPIQRHSAAVTRVHAAQAEYVRVEGELSPLRAAVAGAGADLAAKLRSLAQEADRAADLAASAQKQAESDRHRAQADLATASSSALRLEKEAVRLQGSIEAAARMAADLRAAGALGTSESAADAHQRHTHDAAAAGARAADAVEALAANDADSAVADAAASAAVTAAASAASRVRTARDTRSRFTGEAADLVADAVVAELLGKAPGAGLLEDPATAQALAQGAADAATRAERVAAALDARLSVLDATIAGLERGEVAGSPDDVEQVIAWLLAAGVGAVSALKWMVENLPTVEDRRELVTARPDLANAVVVSDSSRIPAARDILDARGYTGQLAVLVCTPAALTAAPVPGSADAFVLAPHPAMIDPEGARRYLVELRVERDDASARSVAAREQAGAYRRVGGTLDSFTTRWAGQTLSTLDELLSAAVTAHDQARAVEGAAQAGLATLKARREELHGELGAARSAQSASQRLAADCLAGATAQSTADAAALTLARTNRELAAVESARADASKQSEDAQLRRDAAITNKAQAISQGATYRRQQGTVGVAPAAACPDASLPDLEAHWGQLRTRLAAEEAGSVHATVLERVRAEEADALIAVDALAEAVRERAAVLAGQLAAADPQARSASVLTAQSRRDEVAGLRASAEATHEQALAVVAARTPSGRPAHATLPDDWDVSTLASVEMLSAAAEEAATATTARRAELDQAIDDLAGRQAAASTALDQFEVALAHWHGDATPGMPACSLDAAAARTRMRTLVTAATDAAGRVQALLVEERDAFDLVRAAAGDPRWSELRSSIRERCRLSPMEEIALEAADWTRHLEIRVRSLTHDLEELDAHREILVVQLVTLCDTQRRLLHEVTRRSTLPEGLGGLSGQPAFKIVFDARPEAEARGLLAGRVDGWAAELGISATHRVRADDRVRWLTEALRDTVRDRPQSGRFKVEVLKPGIDGQVEYRSPERVGKEYSGGQELTLAVLLYCTLASVRAAHRTSGQRPAGVLLLDNPFGAASNPALIGLQQALALRAGVQLVCATGLAGDPNIVHAFDGNGGVVVTLRNDLDQRRGLHHLRVEDPAALAAVSSGILRGREADDEHGFLTAARYHVNEAGDGQA